MQHKKLVIMLVTIGALLVITTSLWLATAGPAKAQCGSSASSCKNCHEVQGEMPVNMDDTGWHESHAFGDFCYICHAGNTQSMDKVEAHTGMVPPLSDIQAACVQCHPDDLEQSAQVYATLLGVEVGSGGTSAGDTPDTTSSEPVSNLPSSTELEVDDASLVDYVQRYEQIVLGKRPVNWGNVILIAMIAILAIGGGGFALYKEKLINISFGETKTVEGTYPADVVEMLPAVARLTPKMRSSLNNILNDPNKVKKVFNLIDTVYSDKE